MNKYEAALREALPIQTTILDHPERCSVDARALSLLGIGLGQQVRISFGGEFALFTVATTRKERTAALVRMGAKGLARLGATLVSNPHVTLDPAVVRKGLTDGDAKAMGELAEIVQGDPNGKFLVAIAPHGGNIEPGTDVQARRLAERLADRRASSWICCGYKPGGGAYARWHITSTDAHAASFPGLSPLLSRGFSHAVAFHGFSQNEIVVGGGAPLAWKAKVKDAIAAVLGGTGIAVRLASESDHYGGDSPKNVVNRLAPQGGVQIEQPLAARQDHAVAIADAVAELYRALP